MKKLFALMLSTVCLAASAQSEDLYRKDMPAVLTKPADTSSATAVAFFSDQYVKAGKPAVLVMWHKELTDTPSGEVKTNIAVSSRGEAFWDNYDRFITITGVQEQPSTVAFVAPAGSEEFETSLVEGLQSNGVVLVNRAFAIRKLGLTEKTDYNSLETKTLLKAAPVFMEVRFVAKGVRATLTEVDKGTILADVLVSGTAESKWVASSKGFEKSATEASKKALAKALTQKLLAAFGRSLASNK